jgi:hypothetical protein
MIRLTLSARDRRALAIAGVGAILMLGWTLALAPYLEAVGHARDRLDAERELLAREQQLLSEAGAYPALWEAGAGRLLELAPRLFGGESDGAAGAALAGYLQGAARAERVYIHQVEPLPTADTGGGITALTVRLRGESDLEGILGFLDALEAGPKLIRIAQLQIDRAAPRAANNNVRVLTFHLTATGYTLTAVPLSGTGNAALEEDA